MRYTHGKQSIAVRNANGPHPAEGAARQMARGISSRTGSVRGVLRQSRGFVVNLGGYGSEAFLVLLAVMGAEQQLASGGEGDAEVGLRAAAVAAIERIERLGGEEVWCQDSGHVAPSFCVDCARGPDPRRGFQARCAGPGVRSATR